MSDPDEFRHRAVRSSPSDVAVFRNTIYIELTGHLKCGASFLVEVEFSATRGRAGHPGDPDTIAPEIEILSVRPFEYQMSPTGPVSTIRMYWPHSAKLSALLIECIDRDALEADWSEI